MDLALHVDPSSNPHNTLERESVKERVCVLVLNKEKEIERESMCVRVCVREREREISSRSQQAYHTSISSFC